MDKIKIMHIIETLGPGGAERVLLTNLSYLDKDKFQNVVTYLFADDFFLSDLRELGIKVYSLRLRNIYQFFTAIYRLIKIIKTEKINIVHTNLFAADIYGRIAAKLAGVSHVVTTLHNLGYEKSSSFSKRKMIDGITGKFCNSSFIAVSSAVKKSTEKHLGFKNIRVIYNSIDLDRFPPLKEAERIDIRTKLGIEKNTYLLTVVGRLDLEKNHRLLLESLSTQKLGDIDFILLVVGEGPEEQNLRNQCRMSNIQRKVRFLGSRKDVRNIIGCSDLFILPTVSEGFGIVILESMALKIPCLASNIGGIKEVIDNNVNGILVQPDSVVLSNAIWSFLKDENLRKEISDRAYMKVISDFSIKNNIKKLEEVYTDLLKK